MKKLAVLLLILACLLPMSACSGAAAKGEILLKEGTVTEISVSSLPKSYDYTFQGDDAQSIRDYIAELGLTTDFPENPNEYAGMTWVISLEYEDGDILTIYHFGNMFIRTADSSWYKMTYEEASRFDTLISNLSK